MLWPLFSQLKSLCFFNCECQIAPPLLLLLDFTSRSWYFHFHFIYVFVYLFYCLALICKLIGTDLHQIWAHRVSLQLRLQHSINVPHPIRADHISAAPTGFSHWLESLLYCLLPSTEVVDTPLCNYQNLNGIFSSISYNTLILGSHKQSRRMYVNNYIFCIFRQYLMIKYIHCF